MEEKMMKYAEELFTHEEYKAIKHTSVGEIIYQYINYWDSLKPKTKRIKGSDSSK